jgi:hypothetical protein
MITPKFHISTKDKTTNIDLIDVNSVKASSIEIQMLAYNLNSAGNSDDFRINPYEEYSKEIEQGGETTYVQKERSASKIFGIILSILIYIIFRSIIPSSFLTIEAAIAVLGAYTIGKEFWNDIENVLIGLTENWRLSYVLDQYRYKLKRQSTINLYNEYARNIKYKKESELPEQMAFETLSNSKLVRINFFKKTLKTIQAKPLRLVTIDFNGSFETIKAFKLAISRRYFFVTKTTELFQALKINEIGAVDENEVWHKGKCFIRKTYTVGNFKYYSREYIETNSIIA